MSGYLLTINGGSSSIKFALFEQGDSLIRKGAGSVQRLSGLEPAEYGRRAVAALSEWLKPIAEPRDVAAIGHRIVHGGPNYLDHVLITPTVIDELRNLAPIDPDHLPSEIALIEAMAEHFPNVPQIACFDTVFHRDMPTVAKLLPIPRKYGEQGVRRYGFHGLSFAYLTEELGRVATPQAKGIRVILAHLGNGCSMAAVRDGKCIDTTMAFTPTAGLMMGTRTGDLDPGVLVYLMRQEKMDADQMDELVNKQSGLLGVSGTSADMRDLLARQQDDINAAEAVELFCYSARKAIGSLTAALGGLDTLVFSGGIGENSPEVRRRIGRGLEHLGVQIDVGQNNGGEEKAKQGGRKVAPRVISTEVAAVQVWMIPTDEEIMIARITQKISGAIG
jgi:acetate kinase